MVRYWFQFIDRLPKFFWLRWRSIFLKILIKRCKVCFFECLPQIEHASKCFEVFMDVFVCRIFATWFPGPQLLRRVVRQVVRISSLLLFCHLFFSNGFPRGFVQFCSRSFNFSFSFVQLSAIGLVL